MKKIINFIFIITLLLFITGCNGNVTRDIRHAGFTIGGNFICNEFYPQTKNDTNYKKIKYFTSNHLIDADGLIYEISLDMLYSNKENCKKSNTNIVVKAIFDDSIIKGLDNKYYYLIPQVGVNAYDEVLTTDNSYTIYNLLLSGEDVIKVNTANSSTGVYYVLKTDGNIYSVTISKTAYNMFDITDTKIVYKKEDYDSKIIDFKYMGTSLTTFIKTEKKTYRMKIANSECIKYADIECKYVIEEDDMFNKYKDKILMFNGNLLLTDYKKIFTLNDY